MFDSRREMAATWLWWLRQEKRKAGEPATRPFSQQPDDVTDPVYEESDRVIRAMDVWNETRDVLRVDLNKVDREVALKLYRTFHPEVQVLPDSLLDQLVGSIKIMLHHLAVEEEPTE